MNMNKEIRAELRGLKESAAAEERRISFAERHQQRQSKVLKKAYQRSLVEIERTRNREVKAASKIMERLDKRIAILEGRLS
jgi:hypothetical protein